MPHETASLAVLRQQELVAVAVGALRAGPRTVMSIGQLPASSISPTSSEARALGARPRCPTSAARSRPRTTARRRAAPNEVAGAEGDAARAPPRARATRSAGGADSRPGTTRTVAGGGVPGGYAQRRRELGRRRPPPAELVRAPRRSRSPASSPSSDELVEVRPLTAGPPRRERRSAARARSASASSPCRAGCRGSSPPRSARARSSTRARAPSARSAAAPRAPGGRATRPSRPRRARRGRRPATAASGTSATGSPRRAEAVDDRVAGDGVEPGRPGRRARAGSCAAERQTAVNVSCTASSARSRSPSRRSARPNTVRA